MAFETYTGAFERALAHLVTAFGEWPDVCFSQVDLHTAFVLHLTHSGPLDVLYTTRDGRRTPLPHQRYATSPGPDHAIGGDTGSLDHYDIVLLNPSFVRSFELDTVTRHSPLRMAPRAASQGQPLPLLAAANLLLFEHLTPAHMELVERRFFTLVHAEREALHAYLGIFLRQWELDEEAERGLQRIEAWAKQQPLVSVCCVQSYRDRLGHVFTGRYLNDWCYKAPLLPMEFAVSRRSRSIAIPHAAEAEPLFPSLGYSR